MPVWKNNWEETRARLLRWWDRSGVVIGAWDAPIVATPAGDPCAELPLPSESIHLHPQLRAEWNHHLLKHQAFPGDVLPLADTDLGPGSLCLFLGCQPRFDRNTVWFEHCWEDIDHVEDIPDLAFDPQNRWWQLTEETLLASRQLSESQYLTPCPDLVENVDILAALREPQMLMMDFLEEPEWVEEKVRQITDVWFEAYNRIYEIIREPDGSSAFGAFRIWGPGKTAKVQCDASAMFSPEMYRRFVVPQLTRQCDWLDFSLYHLDGTQAVCHLDALLEIQSLDAIEWTPQAGIETGGDPRWYPMYRRILEAGKALQVVGVHAHEVQPLLDTIGTEGIYIHLQNGWEAETVLESRGLKSVL